MLFAGRLGGRANRGLVEPSWGPLGAVLEPLGAVKFSYVKLS